MSLTVHRDLEQGKPEWYAARRGLVTASVVSGLLTVRRLGAIDYDCPKCHALAGEPCLSVRGSEPTPIKTMHQERTNHASQYVDESPLIVEPASGKEVTNLTALLAAERISGHTEDPFTTNDMLRGKLSEPLAVEAYAKHKGVKVETVGLMVLEQDGWRLGYSPDGLVGEDGLVEVKSPRQKTHLLTVLGGKVPVDHMAQHQSALLVSRRKWIDFISYNGGMKLWIKRVYPDPKWFAAIIAAVKQFEVTAADMIARYHDATIDLPLTERVDFNQEIVI